jgi:protein-export membrane protein SecD
LRYGSLPVPLEVAAFDQIGPTLGEISVNRSIRAGVVGVIVVLLFMIIYYRVPGVAAALALIIFAAINFALYKAIPVTLTLPAITGFLISIGTAVDGNILIFERMKEELRSGKDLSKSINLGFDRAWTSIRDSNISTLIICAILFFFGRTFGASAVQGFAITLGLGLVINLFTAIIVTRTWLTLIFQLFGNALRNNRTLMGA